MSDEDGRFEPPEELPNLAKISLAAGRRELSEGKGRRFGEGDDLSALRTQSSAGVSLSRSGPKVLQFPKPSEPNL
jgi:hypothetical protein